MTFVADSDGINAALYAAWGPRRRAIRYAFDLEKPWLLRIRYDDGGVREIEIPETLQRPIGPLDLEAFHER